MKTPFKNRTKNGQKFVNERLSIEFFSKEKKEILKHFKFNLNSDLLTKIEV